MPITNDEIRKFLQKKDSRTSTVTDDDSLLTSGIVDSLKMVELLSFIEKTYNITIDDDELSPDNFETINAIVNFLKNKVDS